MKKMTSGVHRLKLGFILSVKLYVYVYITNLKISTDLIFVKITHIVAKYNLEAYKLTLLVDWILS